MGSKITSVLLADGQPLTVAGLTHILSQKDDLKIIAQVNTREELIYHLEKFRPEVLVADYNLEGYISIEDLEWVGVKFPETNILIISSDNHKDSIMEVLRLGVKGYITKECSQGEVMLAVQSVVKGEKFFCHKILDILMEKHVTPQQPDCDPTVLTVRETEILKYLSNGYSTQRIADELFLSPHTVQTHRKNIIRKLNIKSPTEFVIYAMDLGIIKPKR